MSDMILAAQLFTLRDYLKTPTEIDKTLKKVKEIGYNAVQVSGIGPIEPDKLKEITDKHRLKICATHISFDKMQNNLETVIEEHKLWDCKYVGLGMMPGDKYSVSKKGFTEFARDANKVGQKLKENDLQFIYHNHDFEFVKFNGITGMEILLKETDPDFFHFELDTYWVQSGGGNPAKWITKVEDRMKVVHFKDMGMNTDRERIMAEVGKGNLEWDEIIKACDEIAVKWCAVEQDVCQRNPFESLKISFDFLKEKGLKS